MGKDRSGAFHPGKGKPSGINKEEGLGAGTTNPEKMDEYLELTDKYTDDNEHLQGVPVRHPNRNTSKGEDSYKGKENKAEGNKAVNQSANDEANESASESASTFIEELPSELTRELFSEIADHRADPCISLYLPTHASGMEVNQGSDVIEFKNMLQEVARVLKGRGVGHDRIDQLLKPGYDLIRKEDFWLGLTNGLAVFIAEGYFRFIRMLVAPGKKVFCNSAFLVSPLVALLTSTEYYYLLVVSKQRAKLFRGDRFGLEFIPVEGLPDELTDVTGIAEKNSSTWRASGGGTGGASFHGAGGELDHKVEISSYLEAVDDVLYKKIFNKENAPLLLAGVEYMLPIYRSVCDYHNVYPDALTGSYENESIGDLHEAAQEVMRPYFEQRKKKALQLFADRIATPLTASLNEQVIPASYYGKVSHLFVRRGAYLPGRFDEMRNELELHDPERQESEDLVNCAVQKTLENGGEVFLMEREEMPSDGELAAIFRYQ